MDKMSTLLLKKRMKIYPQLICGFIFILATLPFIVAAIYYTEPVMPDILYSAIFCVLLFEVFGRKIGGKIVYKAILKLKALSNKKIIIEKKKLIEKELLNINAQETKLEFEDNLIIYDEFSAYKSAKKNQYYYIVKLEINDIYVVCDYFPVSQYKLDEELQQFLLKQ